MGVDVPRKEGPAKVNGSALYLDDLPFEDLLHGVTVRSPVPRGRLLGIHFEGDFTWDDFVIVTAKDIPAKNAVTLLQEDQPYLAAELINHAEEAVVLLAHSDKHLLEQARKSVRLEIEELPPVHNIEDSLNKRQIIWGEDNIFKSYLIKKGKVDGVWASAHLVLEGEYHTGAQEQLYIENQGIVAKAKNDEVTIWGSMQCPYYIQKAIMPLFNLPADKVRIIQAETGGGFGGKEEYPSMIAGHAALLSLKAKKAVKMVYSRSEDMSATTKRHPSRTRIKMAVSKVGKLLALDIDFVIDGGAYMTLSPVVLSRGVLHAAGPYSCDNVRIVGRAVATNTPPHGAFRGFGAPQSIFALERHMDLLAAKLKLSPEEFRRKNFIKEGQTLATGQVVREKVDFDSLLSKVLDISDYGAKRAQFKHDNQNSPLKKGIGLATFMHGAGFTGSGEKYLASVAGARADARGHVKILASSTEIGQGANTIFCQLAADALGLPYEMVEVVRPDTREVPDSGPTVASRTSMVVGGLVRQAAEGIAKLLKSKKLLTTSFTTSEFQKACQKYHTKYGPLETTAKYKQPKNIKWDDKTYRGDAYPTYAWACYVAEVEVDTRTYETRVKNFWTVQEVGKVIHPTLAAGQIEGGVAQGVGYALYEKVVWENGRMANNQMTNYIMPTASDVPNIHVHFEEVNTLFGPSGAKGIGELPMDGPAPAILNAVENATGISVPFIPMLPEDLMQAMEKVHG